MGCDIHPIIEYEGDFEFAGSIWQPASKGELLWDRNYRLFELMAYVRGKDGLFEPRGLPDDISYQTQTLTHLLIVSDETDEPHCISAIHAERCVAFGSSTYTSNRRRITHPDWHSHSWLNLNELREVKTALLHPHIGLEIAVAMMEAIERMGKRSRLVFWFDN